MLSALPHQVMNGKKLDICQGYICHDGNRELRIRRINNKFFLTYKRGTGLVRFEQEIPVGKKIFESLWPESELQRLIKTRYVIVYKDRRLEIDLYRKNLTGLIIAEVEFNSEEESRNFQIPSFFGREITEDSSFTNRMLIQMGVPTSLDTGICGYKVGVFPVLVEKGKRDQFVIISSRHKDEWIFPRGKRKTETLDHLTAEQEALEEAGLTGETLPETFFIDTKCGLFKYYRMNVESIKAAWKEKDERQRKTVTWKELNKYIKDGTLLDSLEKFFCF